MSRQSMRKGEVMITVSSMAEGKIRELMQEEQDTIGLRVFVKGGGCHGYQYGMSFETKMSEDDTVVEKGDVKIIMDSQSAPMLAGAEVDYVDALQGSGFAIKNPQAKTTCGCGSSFSA
ncbi:MAG TPA: iron-sulfur cluster insertion protein ErpA [Nitrospiraceae bacterium]|nr:iron-sulfur cluster insertion protein ErpA [Nitrospiraceae bacterium]